MEKSVIGGLTSSAVLLDISISVWEGRKLDRSNTKKIVDDNNAKATNAARVTKSLFVDNPKLEAIKKQSGRVRNYIATVTMPWAGDLRLLPVASYIDVMDELHQMGRDFDSAVDDFLNDYATQVSSMAFKLGKMFNRAEYPTEGEIRHKFRMRFDVYPLPSSGDFRVDAENQLKQSLKENYESALAEQVSVMNKALIARMQETIEHIVDRLGYDETGKAKIFRDSLIDNAVELAETMKNLNVTNDLEVEKIRKELERLLVGIDAEELRKSDEIRADVQARAKSILRNYLT